jgi:tetratricopeptide (TPR) repeat protein
LAIGFQLIQAEIYLAQENYPASSQILQEVSKVYTASTPVDKLLVLLMMLFTYIGLGELEQAHRQIDEIISLVETYPSPRTLMMRAWAEARLAVAERQWKAAFSAYNTCYNLASQTSVFWRQASIREEWARSLALRNEPGDLPRAREMMQEAIAIFEQMHAPEYVARLREKLEKMAS